MRWGVVVLAAGKGTRMRSALPKVLHELAGRPLVDHVTDLATAFARAADVVVVVGHGAGDVGEHLAGRGMRTAVQEPQLGTGDAVRVGLSGFVGDAPDAVLVLSGDVPLLRPATLRALRQRLETGSAAVLLTARLAEPGSYGRIVRGAGAGAGVEAIVEARDAPPEVLALAEVNAGVYAFRFEPLAGALQRLAPDNDQGELYLTDVVALLRAGGLEVTAVVLDDPEEMLGVNTREDLARLEEILQRR